jgi:hypothetical protein
LKLIVWFKTPEDHEVPREDLPPWISRINGEVAGTKMPWNHPNIITAKIRIPDVVRPGTIHAMTIGAPTTAAAAQIDQGVRALGIESARRGTALLRVEK